MLSNLSVEHLLDSFSLSCCLEFSQDNDCARFGSFGYILRPHRVLGFLYFKPSYVLIRLRLFSFGWDEADKLNTVRLVSVKLGQVRQGQVRPGQARLGKVEYLRFAGTCFST